MQKNTERALNIGAEVSFTLLNSNNPQKTYSHLAKQPD